MGLMCKTFYNFLSRRGRGKLSWFWQGSSEHWGRVWRVAGSKGDHSKHFFEGKDRSVWSYREPAFKKYFTVYSSEESGEESEPRYVLQVTEAWYQNLQFNFSQIYSSKVGWKWKSNNDDFQKSAQRDMCSIQLCVHKQREGLDNIFV